MEFELSNSTIQLDKKQDFSYSQKIGDHIWLVVADGHSAFSKNFYDNKLVINYIKELDWNTFLVTNNEYPLHALQNNIISDISYSYNNGATITIVKIDTKKNNIKIWWKGDSTAIIYKDNKLAYETANHNIFNEKEVERLQSENINYIRDKKGTNIKLLGGNKIEIVNSPSYLTFSNNDKINMTNCLGHNKVTGLFIDYYEYNFNSDSKIKIIVATDGFWDMYYRDDDDDEEHCIKCKRCF
jgi:serine/threonine protein phosphatase PrpC